MPAQKHDNDHFSFEHKGETYTMPVATNDVITAGFVRANRHREDVDYHFTAMETVAGDSPEGAAILAVLDGMSRAEFRGILKQWDAHLGATLGE